MRIRPFEYTVAENLEGALDTLNRHAGELKVLAGGTDLVLAMKEKTILPSRVMSLHRVEELNFVEIAMGSIRIGALATHADLEGHASLRKETPLLCEAVGTIGSWQIRNVGTIGGNLCTASPAADSAPALLALDAHVVLAKAGEEQTIPVRDFFKGPGETTLEPNQLLKEIVIERNRNKRAGCYLKFMRKRAVDLAVISVAFLAETDPACEKLSRVAIGLGGVAPTPIRASEAEALLNNLNHENALKAIPASARAAANATRPITDVRATASYRRAMVEVYVRRAAKRCLDALFNGGAS